MSALFSPFSLKDVTLRNRVVVPPMCQYSAVDGVAGDWHRVHYASLARGGAGLVIVEATAVSPEGRITPACVGLWNDDQVDGLARVAAAIRAAGAVPGIQIGHAGRKASGNRPWEGGDHIPEDDPRGWPPIGPSALAFGGGFARIPRAMSVADIARVQGDFAAAAQRARGAGFDWLELHFAHGYLAQSFFSSRSNHRVDAYGGGLENRGRFLIETLAAVRQAWPENSPLTARFGVAAFDGRDDAAMCESIALAQRMRAGGLDLLSVSIDSAAPGGQVPLDRPAFLAPMSGRIRREAGVATATAWNLDDPQVADRVVSSGDADLVMMGRAHLANPHYPRELAAALGELRPSSVLPPQYAHWLATYRGAAGRA